MIVERKNGCDCPNGNFYCEVMGCVRGIRTRKQLEADSDEATRERIRESQNRLMGPEE